MEQEIRRLIKFIKEFLKKKLKYESDELPYFLSIILSAVIFIIGINIFLELADSLAENELHTIDNKVTNFFISLRNNDYTPVVIFITHIGNFFSYLFITTIIASVLLLKKKNNVFILQIATVNVLAFLINFFLKGFYGRNRPDIEHLVEATHMSFPSGHAMSAAAYFGFLIYLSWRYIKSGFWKYFNTIICLLLILSIGLSRIYLGVHYPSDVLAGFAGGFFWITFCIVVFNIIGLRRKRKIVKI